jgi:hypothetical protein
MDPYIHNHGSAIQSSITVLPPDGGSRNTAFVASTVVHARHPAVVNTVLKEHETASGISDQVQRSRPTAQQGNATDSNRWPQSHPIIPASRPSIDAAVYSESTLPIESTRGRGRVHFGAEPSRASQDVARFDSSFLSRNKHTDEVEQQRFAADPVEPEATAEAARLKQMSLKNLRRTIRSEMM